MNVSVLSLFVIIVISTILSTATNTDAALTAFLGGSLSIDNYWNTTSGKISFTLETNIQSNYYAALASSNSGMSGGLGVACLMPTGSTSATCVGINTFNYGVSARVDSSIAIESSTVSATKATVKVAVNAASLGVTTEGQKRVIFSIGTWSAATLLPLKHANSASRASAQLSFSKNGAPTPPPSGAGKYEMMMTALICGLLVVFAVMF